MTERPWTAQEFKTLMDDKTINCFGTATCFVLFRTVLDEAEILTLATHPNFQRQGQAHGLLTQALEQLRIDGIAQVFLEVAADNQPAIGLYAKVGFQEIGRRAGYYRRADGKTHDAVTMQAILT